MSDLSVLLAAVNALLCHLLKARSIFENNQTFTFSLRNLMTVVSVSSDFSPFDMVITDSLKFDIETQTLYVYRTETEWKKSYVLKGNWTITWAFSLKHISYLTNSVPMKIWSLECLSYIYSQACISSCIYGKHSPIIFYKHDILCIEWRYFTHLHLPIFILKQCIL